MKHAAVLAAVALRPSLAPNGDEIVTKEEATANHRKEAVGRRAERSGRGGRRDENLHGRDGKNRAGRRRAQGDVYDQLVADAGDVKDPSQTPDWKASPSTTPSTGSSTSS